jgi:ABC-type Fe3+/spermidine/putrescine transport system ATPase subunit
MMLTVTRVSRAFDGLPVLRGVDLHIQQGEIIGLLGASGSGKTTLLRIIAGLETADNGDVLLDGHSMMSVPVHRRDFGLMFQDFALFPHMNVEQNVGFGLKMRGMHPQKRVGEVLQLVGLDGFEKRDVSGLSGGERQRVALARSLAPNPRLLLLDEPLGSLDASLRERLAVELRAIIKNTGLTAVHVTHDQQEAFAIADRIAVMHQGQIEQIDTPETLYHQPKTTYIARFLGLHNIIPVQRHEGGQVYTPVGTFDADGAAVLLHPDGIRLSDEGVISGTIEECVFMGDVYRLTLRHESGFTLTFKHPSQGRSIPPVGTQVKIAAEMVIGLAESTV